MVHTDSKTYWDPLKPRINIYAFTDTTYSSPLYTYNAFTDPGGSGQVDKPIALAFESQTTTAGTFQLEIDDSADTLDPDVFLRGNRVVIECSKDGSTWQTAFKGLVRSGKQKIFAQNNRTLTLEGYSYLIRLSERILDTKKQARLNAGKFDRTDTAMFSDNLINDLLTNDVNYVHTVDDTQLYSIFKTTNVQSSPIDDWVPRIDCALSSLGDGINSVLEFTNSLLTVDFSNDQLVLFNPDRVPSTGGAGIFLLTDAMNMQADDANYTMYPISDYTYQISYDYPDSGNRLIGSIGTAQCPGQTIVTPGTPGTGPSTDPDPSLNDWGGTHYAEMWQSGYGNLGFGVLQTPSGTPVVKERVSCGTAGTPTGVTTTFHGAFWTYSAGNPPVSPVGSSFPMYVGGVAGTALPVAPYGYTTPGAYYIETPSTFSFSGLTSGTTYWFIFYVDSGIVQGDQWQQVVWGERQPYDGVWVKYQVSSGTWLEGDFSGGTNPRLQAQHIEGSGTPGTPGSSTTIDPCGGLPESADADPTFMIASDRNTGKRIGMVEQAVTNMPVHVKTFQTMAEFMYNKLYVMARPRFNFDYPSVTVPGQMPKAGDICVHVSKKAQVGRARTALQTGVIAAVNYQFGQDNDSVLGLRKLAIATTGIVRGTY